MRAVFTRRLVGALTVGGMTLLVCASGAGASVSAKQLVKNAIAATRSVSSLTYAGTVKEGSETISLNVSADVAPGTGEGTIGIGNGTATVRLVGGTVYLKADQAFLTKEAGKSAAQLLAGKWVSTAATSASGKSLAEFIDGSTFLNQVFSSNLTNSGFVRAGTGKVNGKSAIIVSGQDAKGTSRGSLYVAKSGQPYILRLVFSSNTTQGVITFSNYNRPVLPVAPTGAIDLDTLGSQG